VSEKPAEAFESQQNMDIDGSQGDYSSQVYSTVEQLIGENPHVVQAFAQNDWTQFSIGQALGQYQPTVTQPQQPSSQAPSSAITQEKQGGDAEKVDGQTAVTIVLAFLTSNMDKNSNYCVALLGDGDLIISKVNGVTGAAGGMEALKSHIRLKKIEKGRSIYLAQKYNNALGSNHAEMCIVAAAKEMGKTVDEMGCTGPNCPYCAAMLEHEKIDSRNAGQDGKAQQGWAHPTEPVFWGSQVKDVPVDLQVADLKAYLKGAEPKIGKRTLNVSQGRSTLWVSGNT
jgi:hypothetical protein